MNSTSSGSCTITNTTSRGFNVTKVFSDGNRATVTVILTCDSPASVTNTDTTANGGDDANFTVSGFTPTTTKCSATESGQPAGYTPDYTNCTTVTITLGTTPLTCTITNNATATLKVTKSYSPSGPATSVSATPHCTAGTIISPAPPQTVPIGATGFTFNLSAIPASASCTVTETGGAPGYAEDLATSTCDNAQSVSAGATASCNFNNVPSSTTLTIHKDFIPDTTGQVTVTLSCPGTGTVSGGNVTANSSIITGDGTAVFTITAWTAGDTCTASESSIATGYEQTGTTCFQRLLVQGTDSCTLTNKTHAQFIVNKVYSDAHTTPTVNVNATCDNANGTTTITPANLTVDPATPGNAQFTVRGFTDASLTTCHFVELPVPAGYHVTYSAACNQIITTGSTYTCTVTNNVNTETLKVNKVYSDDSPVDGIHDYRLRCTGTLPALRRSRRPAPTTVDRWQPHRPARSVLRPTTDTCSTTETVPAGLHSRHQLHKQGAAGD